MTDSENILIVRYGEIALKGMNKPYFEKTLLKRLRKAIGPMPAAAEIADGLIVVRGYAKADEEALAQRLLRVFGVATVSPAWELASREQEDINAAAVAWMERRLDEAGAWMERRLDEAGAGRGCPLTYKVFGKRSDKNWPVTSPEIAALAGEAVLEAFGEERVKVDVHGPEVRLHIHLRRKNVLVFDDIFKGFGGMPLGTNGKGLVLLSGGIDSPVAAWMIAKRGMTIEAVHFHSYPYTSKRAEDKVMELADELALYCGRIRVHIINILPAQEALAEACPEEELTILIRRFMIRVAERVAESAGCGFLITGENLGQVASQTAESIAVTDRASALPILRPLIAFDKVDIMERAREIGTYEISIQPYEDCCTVFLPKRPVTRPALSAIEKSEALLGAERMDALIGEALATEEVYTAKPKRA